MIRLPCGWDYQRGFLRSIGCHIWVGHQPWRVDDKLTIQFSPPHFHEHTAFCQNCLRGFQVRHLGQGVFVRPKEEGDDAPLPKLPKLEELYS